MSCRGPSDTCSLYSEGGRIHASPHVCRARSGARDSGCASAGAIADARCGCLAGAALLCPGQESYQRHPSLLRGARSPCWPSQRIDSPRTSVASSRLGLALRLHRFRLPPDSRPSHSRITLVSFSEYSRLTASTARFSQIRLWSIEVLHSAAVTRSRASPRSPSFTAFLRAHGISLRFTTFIRTSPRSTHTITNTRRFP